MSTVQLVTSGMMAHSASSPAGTRKKLSARLDLTDALYPMSCFLVATQGRGKVRDGCAVGMDVVGRGRSGEKVREGTDWERGR